MNNLFPENSYMGKCSCGRDFIAPKGVIHCHLCLYQKISEVEKLHTQSHWISVEDAEPEEYKRYWFVHNSTVYRGRYLKPLKAMQCGRATLGFTHFAESPTPIPPKVGE